MTYVSPNVPVDNNQLPPEIPTWESHYLIPIVQNITGGAAVSLLGFIGVIAYTGAVSEAIDLYNAGVWCALGGGIVACVITVVRFFGDDLGIVTGAYRMGRADEHALLMPRIARLELELRASYDAQFAAQENGGVIDGITKRQEEINRSRGHAFRIIEVAFNGDKTSREAMKSRGIGQRDWERAYRLLIACGVMRDDGVILAATPNEAYAAIDEQLGRDGKSGDTFVPKWV